MIYSWGPDDQNKIYGRKAVIGQKTKKIKISTDLKLFLRQTIEYNTYWEHGHLLIKNINSTFKIIVGLVIVLKKKFLQRCILCLWI